MKFVCVKENLEYAVSIAERFTGKNITLPILSNILIESKNNLILVTATNLEYALQILVPGKIYREGKISVPAKILSQLLQLIKNKRLECEARQENLIINTDTQNVCINGTKTEDFPLIPKLNVTSSFLVDPKLLQDNLIKIMPAVSTSEFKPELSGVFFRVSLNSLELAATDTFRLTESKITISKKREGDSFSFILPHRVSQEIARIFGEKNEDVKISIGDNQVVFEIEGIKVLSRLIDGNFPEYSSIIPKQFSVTAFLNRQEFIDAVKSSSIFASRIQGVNIHFYDKVLEISSTNPDIGENKIKIPVSYTGGKVQLNFNYRYLLDGINSLSEEELFIGVNDETKPSLIHDKSDNSFKYILMPIRLS